MLAANRILTVDDTPMNLTIIEETFPDPNELCPAGEANETRHSLLSLSPDVVFVEVVMPRPDGCEFCNQIKNNPDSTHGQAMMVSAQTELDAMLRGLYPFTTVCQCSNSIESSLPVTMSNFGA
ncbi:response regulator PleD [Symmachiella dynata]|uniref:response regulator n=1 Tax=Symmachiella dynata TaxID=2527995 RepID=UPI00118BCE0F|nr:response regulator [Symmachiella dynata]QDT50549.1 response regulator PleD [Symmachiella dynata]